MCVLYLSQEILPVEAEAEYILEAVRQDAAQYILPAAGAVMEAVEDVFEKLAQFKKQQRMMIIDASADALYRSAGSGAWRGRAFWLCLV